ncbi:membrane-spanning 4-domains subfamily A member 15-like isoform X1 [Lates japonicus]|uniref:Membrane-spanning 4-domains subfamily A member 15-like isoform X1 n=1 Tax=Lates japonicus TaxID=270547 RepID=A0AAD3MQ18_LATJO|nr:membrane-spanning 4-domains subfamily A member 15-like isoform X1 [Lates japonicus]
MCTHVHPAPQGATSQRPVGIQKFSRASPMALGTVQIMIGLMTLLFGIVLVAYPDTLGIYSGIFVWGAAIHILAGSLTVAAGKSLNRCLLGYGCCAHSAEESSLVVVGRRCFTDCTAEDPPASTSNPPLLS